VRAADGFTGLTADQAKYLGVRSLINQQIQDLIRVVERRVVEWGIDSPDAARNAPECTVGLSDEMAALNEELRQFLMERVYRNYRVVRMAIKAQRVIEGLFCSYLEHPGQLPPAALGDAADLPRGICDYLAGLTDREALDEHRRLFDPNV
jgi:dGTPase